MAFATEGPLGISRDLCFGNQKGLVLIVVASMLAVFSVFLLAVISISIVSGCRYVVQVFVQLIWLIGEICVSIIAAITSGATVSMSIIAAATVSAFTLPPSLITARIGVAAAVSSLSVASSAAALFSLTSMGNVHPEVAIGVVSAAAVSVAGAAAWAVGVMSLIEKDTHQVGLRLTRIMDAVRHNNHRILWLLLKLHPLGIKQRDLDAALQYAVKAGFTECIDVLLENGAEVNSKDTHGDSPLTLACDVGDFNTVKMLIARGAQINMMTGLRRTALHHAARWGYSRCVALLLDHGAEVNVLDAQWQTPLMMVVGHAHRPYSVMQRLVDAGAEVNTMGLGQKTALHHAASRGLDLQILLVAGASVHTRDSEGETVLHLAAREGHADTIAKLIEYGSDVEAENLQHQTALHLAASRGTLKSVQFLLESGACPSKQDINRNRPIFYAAQNGHLRIVQAFIRRNIPLGPFNHNNMRVVSSPLEVALEQRHLAIAQSLLIGGCDVAPLNSWLLDVPLECSTEYHNVPALHWLREFVSNPTSLAHKCRLKIRQTFGKRILEYAHHLPLPTQLILFILFENMDLDPPMVSDGHF